MKFQFFKWLAVLALGILSGLVLAADDAYEPNNTLASATNLPLVKGIGNLTGLKSMDADWFKVSLPKGVFTAEAIFSPAGGDVRIEIYNATGVRINDDSQGTTSPTGRKLSTALANAGTYYVVTSGSSGNAYALLVKTRTVWANEFPYGPIVSGSVTLYDLDGDGIDEILIGTTKYLDANRNEIRPAALLCLNANGTLRWAKTFPANTIHRSLTNQPYTTSSVGGAPLVADLFNDGQPYIVVGTGGMLTNNAAPGTVGQPGDLGAVYALDRFGNTVWTKAALDTIGGPTQSGDGIADGIWGSIVAFDIDNDGFKDVIWGGWDQRVWVVDGRTGVTKPNWPIHVLDTIGSTPKITNLAGDNNFKILIGSDITANADAQITQTGGVFHVFSPDGQQNTAGFDSLIGRAVYPTVRGKFEAEVLWSSPAVADLDGDGKLEIVYGTGSFFRDGRGEYLRVWNHDGTLRDTLVTQGRSDATPLIADLEGDGQLRIVTATSDGRVMCWDALGNLLWNVQPRVYPDVASNVGIFSSPLAVDIDGDGKLEIIVMKGAQLLTLDRNGNTISPYANLEYVIETTSGTPAVKDIDGDGLIDYISGGTTANQDRAVVYRFSAPTDARSPNARYARQQFNSPSIAIDGFVKRMYLNALGRAAEPAGVNYWADSANTRLKSGADIANGFFLSAEFTNRALSDSAFLDTLYRTLFDRAADAAGKAGWQTRLNAGESRANIIAGFTGSTEFDNLCKRFSILTSQPVNPRVSNIRAFVTRLYSTALSRAPDAAGADNWTYQLINRISSATAVSRGFFFSAEYSQKNTTNSVFLEDLYRAFFNRASDAGGKAFWTNALANGTSRQEVLNGFSQSAEFATLAAAYGLTP
jgi:Domain of unknown function (DUF4214)